MQFFRSIYLTNLFFLLYGAVTVLFAVSFAIPVLFTLAKILLIILLLITFADGFIVFYAKNPVSFQRTLNQRMNLGDENKVSILVKNEQQLPVRFRLYEGFPKEMQERSLFFTAYLEPGKSMEFTYNFKPVKRGDYLFGNAFFVLASTFNLISRRYEITREEQVRVYPSVLQMKKYELMVFQQQQTSAGIKKIRRIGNTTEFEQVRNYVQGDEIRTINWKATSRKNELMVNQYQEEKAQHVYFLIDKSRPMQAEFNGMSMLDYAINSTLVLSNIALRKGDKAGLITFSDKIGTILPAERKQQQLRRIMDELYNQKTRFLESSYELLYQTIRRTIQTRSLLILFCNYETEFAMRRALPTLRQLNKKHVLVVVFFENTDLQELAYREPENVREVYRSVVAERMISMKGRIMQELRQNGIQTVLTLPSELSVNTINKYLELKARGVI